jgi:hypothetical protein
MTMSNNFGLTFNDKAFYDDVCKQLVKAVQAALDKLQNTMQAYSGESKISGAWMNVIKMAEGKIIGYVGNDHWWAFIDNFGSGSKLDKSNPWLQEYVESGFFNKERLDFDYAVVSRFGHYYSPDWIGGDGYKEHTGSGRRTVEGNPINLERLTNPRSGKPYYVPQSGKHWLEEVMAQAELLLDDYIIMALDDFEWDSDEYLKGGV